MPCRTCGSPLAADQRYCLECGDRNGPPRLDWRALVVADPAASALPEPAGGGGLPSPRVAAALVLGVLGFGVALSSAVGTSPADAGGRPRWTLVAQAPAVAAAALPAPAAVAPAPEPTAPETDGAAETPTDDAAALDDSASADDAAGTGDATSGDDAPAADDTTATDEDTSTDDTATDDPATTPAPKHPPVKHVWVVSLTGHSFAETFGDASPAPYLATELRAKGTLLPWYHAAGHDPAAGGVALLGGQKDATGPFDDQTATLADQLTGIGSTWRAYVEGATAGLQPGDNPCRVPAAQQPRNPFLRFGTITGGTDCQIAEPAQLATDVQDAASAPAFSYVVPGAAHDGSTTLADADAWLKTIIPTILGSQAYADGGLVVITFDAGAPGDAEAGGGRVGALLLSSFVAAGGTVNAPYDPFALLNSIQDLFGLEPRLGYGAETKLKPFGPKVYATWSADAADGGS